MGRTNPFMRQIGQRLRAGNPAPQLRYGQRYGRSQTPVCPAGQEVCGDALPGHAPPCCPIVVQGPTPGSANDQPLRCWGPSWDQSCKACLPVPGPTGMTTSCTYFKVNNTAAWQRLGLTARQVQRAATQKLDVYGKWYTPRRGSRSL